MAAINVLVVDDSVVIRRLVTTVLEEDPDISVVGTAASGRIALAKLEQLAPDCLTLDVEMPELDGLGTLRELRRTHKRLPVVMFSTLTERGASATLEALSAGASDYVCKPANVGSVPEAIESVRSQLVPKIKALCAHKLPRALVPGQSRVVDVRPQQAPAGRVEVLAVGSSTGGPDALREVLGDLPASFPVPIVVVQHMPPVFTRLLAERLDGLCQVSVKEAQDGDRLRPGLVLIAPGDRHLEVMKGAAGPVVRLTSAPPENFCRPAVDVLFRSVAATYGGATLAVVLTGMGSDGLRGTEVLRRAGAEVVVQDQATSVVWGMPGAVAGAGLAHRVLPLREVAGDVRQVVARGRAGVRA